MSQASIINDILRERLRQDQKWGQQTHPIRDEYLSQAEYDGVMEQAKAECQARAEAGTVSWLHILYEEVSEAMAEVDYALQRAELIQAAAVVVAMIEDIDRRTGA
jgi:hypothetical protein